LGIKIVFKSKAKTLLKTDIDLILLKIQNELKQNLNIEVRI
jgi:phenylalanyl-tRNA synthetase beta subunit